MAGAALLCVCAACAGFGLGFVLAARSRRRSLNEAVHELRRPLQALALVSGSDAREWLPPAGAALADLDRRINRGRGRSVHRRVGSIDLLRSADRRWRPVAAVRVEVPDVDAQLDVDPVAVGSALDNLIANAVEHGRGPVRVSPALEGPALALRVMSRGGLRGPSGRATDPDPGRGHGLRVAERIAREQRGSLRCGEGPDGVVSAALKLPVAAPR